MTFTAQLLVVIASMTLVACSQTSVVPNPDDGGADSGSADMQTDAPESEGSTDADPGALPEEEFLDLTLNELTTDSARDRYCQRIADVWWGPDLGDANCYDELVALGAEAHYPDNREEIFSFCLGGISDLAANPTPDCDWETVRISIEYHAQVRDLWCTDFSFSPFTNWRFGPHPEGEPAHQCPFERLP